MLAVVEMDRSVSTVIALRDSQVACEPWLLLTLSDFVRYKMNTESVLVKLLFTFNQTNATRTDRLSCGFGRWGLQDRERVAWLHERPTVSIPRAVWRQ